MNDLNLYMPNKDTIANEKLNIQEKNNEIENFVGNYIKNKPAYDNYIKKNFSYSKVFTRKKDMYKAKTSININKVGATRKNSYASLYKTKTCKNSSSNIFENRKNASTENPNLNYTNIDNLNNETQFTKHSSMKYFKVSPMFSRVYFSPEINIQTTNNNEKHCNLYMNNIKDNQIKEIDEDTPSTSRKTQSLNKIDNKPVHIVSNNNNYTNNNNTNERNSRKIKNDKRIVFMKKRIPSCPRKSLSKPKNEIMKSSNENENENNNKKKINDKNIYNINTNICNINNNKIKNKKIDNLQFEETCSIYIRNSKNQINNNNYYLNYNANTLKFPDNINNKFNNIFNKATIKQNKAKINIEEMHKNCYVNIRNKYNKDYITTNNNSNANTQEETKIAFKELNLEDFLLIIQKFDDIINNLKVLNSFCSINLNQSMNSTKKILEINNMNRIKLYDLFKFYMGSSFDGSPEKLFSSKKSKFYYHCYTIIFILSIGLLYIISQNIKLTQECFEEIYKKKYFYYFVIQLFKN